MPVGTEEDIPFGEWLRQEMERRGYELEGPRAGGKTRLAQEADVSLSIISRILSGGRVPEIKALRAIGQVFGIPLGDMMIRAGLAEAHEMVTRYETSTLSPGDMPAVGLVIPGVEALTADGYPIPALPKGVELPKGFDASSIPLHEVEIWFVENTTVKERAGMVTWLRGRRQEEQDAAALLREVNGRD